MSEATIRCSKCGLNKARSDYFPLDQAKASTQPCKQCKTNARREYNKNHPEAREAQRRYTEAYQAKMRGDPEYEKKRSARGRANYLVASGKIPSPKDLPCVDCGLPAEQYDHYLGYEEDHWEDVQPVCKTCHGSRATARGEFVNSGRPKSIVDGTTSPG